MIHGDELIMLLLGLAVLAFIVMNKIRLRRIPGFKVFVSAFFCFLAAWIFTVLEGFFWEDTFNLLEHALYVSGTGLLLVWALKFGRKNKLENG
jgi:glucan phosphoethanolaminetransferase (alkaline phosphatase superfamily)